MNKIIHYIWLGGKPKTPLIKKCIKSWKKYMPDWEIKEWNEGNLNLDINTYCRQAYDLGMYAFASDVLRFSVLEKYGGIYFDTDVEILKSFEDLTEKNEAFCSFEYNGKNINPGLVLFTRNAHNPTFIEMLEVYNNINFEYNNGFPKTVCRHFMDLLNPKGLIIMDKEQTVEKITIYPSTYFCPTNNTWTFQNFSKNTYSIHHYNASWLNRNNSLITIKRLICKLLGPHGIKIIWNVKNTPVYKIFKNR